MPEENKTLVHRWTEEIWNQGSMTAIDEIVAADYVHHDPLILDIRGREALKQHVASLHAAFPDICYTNQDLIAEGDIVAARFAFAGTHHGEWMGNPPTGKRMQGTGTVMLRIAQGKVAELWAHYDALSVMRTVGAITDPATLAVNKAVLRRYAENLHTGGNSVAFGLVADDVVMHSPHTPAIKNRAEFEEYVTRLDAAFSGIRFMTQDLIAEGDRVALRFTFAGTQTSEWKGMAPTGKAIEISGAGTYRLRAGKIVEIWVEWDALGLMQQLGAAPAVGQPMAAAAR
ncbi:MAG: ester cyclase [Bryobacteraceae bacterium]